MRSGLVSGGPGVYILDTSIRVLVLRGDAPIRARLATATQLYVSSVALGELYVGAYGSPTRASAAVADIASLAVSYHVIEVAAVTADIYVRTKHDLKRRGLTMPDNDIWIAATAIHYSITLAARDAHFNWITGLHVEQW